MSNGKFQIGGLQIDPARNRLVSGDIEIRLEPRVMDVLCFLAEHSGEVVSREAIIKRLWATEYGVDESLTRAVSLIRKAFREAGVTTTVIETIKKRGYRLKKSITQNVAQQSTTQAPVTSATSSHNQSEPNQSHSRVVIGLLLLLSITIIMALFMLWLFNSERKNSAVEPSVELTVKSVAILPFKALSNDDSDAYFGAGIAEEILNALSRFSDLKVIARTSAFTIDSDTLKTDEIGQQLGVNHIVTGSVRRDGERIRISAQLINTAAGASLWSNTYEVDATELFSVEDEIVRDVAQSLQVRLGVGAAAGRSDGKNIDPLAYEQYLQGLAFLGDRMRSNGNREAALVAFQRAVSFDPNFADAWAGIGMVGVVSIGSPLSRDREAFGEMIKDALKHAIELDPDSPKAHAALTGFYALQRIDIDAARNHLEQAQATAPNAASTHYSAGWLYRALGNAEAALAAYDRAMILDPLNNVIARVHAELLIEIGRFDEGMAFFEDCYASQCLQEGFVAYASAAAVFTGNADYMATWLPRLNAFEQRIADIPNHLKPKVARIMPTFFSVRLNRDDAAQRISATQQLFKEQLITDTPGIWGPTFAQFLDQDTLLDMLHLAYERGDLFSATFAFSPMYGVNPYPQWLLEHPRYHELWQRPGMPELATYWRAANRTAALPKPATVSSAH